MNEKMTFSYYDNISLIEDIDHIIAIENNYFLLFERKKNNNLFPK